MPSDKAGMLQAKSVDAAFLCELKAARFRGRVHSVFERVINIGNADGELFTLACRGLDNAPNTAVIDTTDFGKMRISVNDAVAADGSKLNVGPRVTVLLTAAAAWHGSVLCYPDADDLLQTNVRWIQTLLDRYAQTGGMVGQRDGQGRFALAMTALLRKRALLLLEALRRDHPDRARLHAKSMIGLGPGLTPSGDDFLVGLLAVLHLGGNPCRAWLAPVANAVMETRQSTNAISFAALSQAAGGRVRESIATLIDCMMYGTPESLVGPAHRVLAIGSTSGTDILAGILAGFESNLQALASRPRPDGIESGASPIAKSISGLKPTSSAGRLRSCRSKW